MKKRRIGIRTIGVAAGLVLAGCGSGGSSGEDPIEGGTVQMPADTPADTVVMPVSCVADPAAAGCEMMIDPPGADTAEFVASGETRTGTLERGQRQLFRVPSGAEISLISTSGDADLFLHNMGENLSIDTLLCRSEWPVAEDNCTAMLDDGDMFAEVVGFTAAEFSISASTDCSVPAVNEWVYRNMQDYYLYADSVPVVDPASFASPADLVRELRLNEFDPFSGISDAVTRSNFFESGALFGFGNGFARDVNGNLRISLVFDNSPFGRANVQRGDIVVSINNEPIDVIVNEGRYFDVIGDRDNPIINDWRFVDGETGLFKDVTVAQGEFTINSVLHSDIYTNDSVAGSVGYIVFSDFIGTSEAELDTVFADFAAEGITQLILDLRYNGGGLVSVANRLASQIGGPGLDSLILTIQEYNSTYSFLNTQDFFTATTPSVDIDRLIVIGGGGTASASELVTNSLKPYMDVVLIGDTTVGKPFFSRSKTYCGRALSAMESESVNANRVSVAGGIAADCFAADDVTRRFGGVGANTERMLLAALDFVALGSCDAPPAFAKNSKSTGILSTLNNERPDSGLHIDSVKASRYR